MRIEEVRDSFTGDITISCYYYGEAYHKRLLSSEIIASELRGYNLIEECKIELQRRMERYIEQISAQQYEVNSRRVDAASGYYTTGVGQSSLFNNSINNNAVWKDNVHYTKTVTISEWNELNARIEYLESLVNRLVGPDISTIDI